jgi:quinoprotein glucose dehydrogenase
VAWTERLSKARSGLYTPPGLIDTIQIPSVTGGTLFFGTGADPASGLVFVEAKNVPSILKMVPGDESTAANAGSSIPSVTRPSGRGRGPGGPPMPLRIGRAVYEGSCQSCHGPDLKGDRGPGIDNAVSRLGADSVRSIISKGKGGMPPFSSIRGEALTDLMAFLAAPESAPSGSALPANQLAERLEPDYPADVTPPPARYKTGYGQEGYVITPPWSTITAYDLNTGKMMWQTPYGDTPQAGPSDKLRGNIFPKSGFVVLGSDLIVFVDNESKLYALNKKTGEVVLTKDMPNGAIGVPAVYEVNGREYILFALTAAPGFPAGGRLPPGGVNPPAGAKTYVALALPR